MQEHTTPYVCHVLVCVNDRRGERKACADGESGDLRAYLKAEVERRGWKPRVRVSQTGCLGLCQKGPNVMLYPQGIWFNDAGPKDADEILSRVAEFLA